MRAFERTSNYVDPSIRWGDVDDYNVGNAGLNPVLQVTNGHLVQVTLDEPKVWRLVLQADVPASGLIPVGNTIDIAFEIFLSVGSAVVRLGRVLQLTPGVPVADVFLDVPAQEINVRYQWVFNGAAPPAGTTIGLRVGALVTPYSMAYM